MSFPVKSLSLLIRDAKVPCFCTPARQPSGYDSTQNETHHRKKNGRNLQASFYSGLSAPGLRKAQGEADFHGQHRRHRREPGGSASHQHRARGPEGLSAPTYGSHAAPATASKSRASRRASARTTAASHPARFARAAAYLRVQQKTQPVVFMWLFFFFFFCPSN